MKEHPELSKYQWTFDYANTILLEEGPRGLIDDHNKTVKELLERISVLSEIGAALATQ